MNKVLSLNDLLHGEGLLKDFYFESKEQVYKIINDKSIDFTKPLSKEEFGQLLNHYSKITSEQKDKLLSLVDDSFETVDDDVFGFAAQEVLTEIAEDPDANQDKMFEIKAFLTYHMIYKEAMVDSPYDRALRIRNGEDPELVNSGSTSTSGTSVSVEPIVDKFKEFKDSIDQKYLNPVYKHPKTKAQKAEFYKGCKVIIEGSNISDQVFPAKWDKENKLLACDQGFDHDYSKAYVIFKTEVPEIGDIVVVKDQWILLGDKDTLSKVKDFIKENGASHTYYTTKFNNRKVEKLNVKRYSCGSLDKDISEVPYHVEIIYEDVEVNYDYEKISKHYNIEHDKLIKKEVDLLKQLEITLDHRLNVARSEWALLVGQAGSGKTQVALDYAKKKNKEYVLMQGTAQLTVDDLVGYKSITDGTYFPSLLREAVEKGKVLIIDEIDACNPNTLLALNSLKNKVFQFPDKLVTIHPEFRLIATANTLEYSDEYNGRSKLDKATITRFSIIDANMENFHLALRYGLKYIKNIANIDRKSPREIEREVVAQQIQEEIDEQNSQNNADEYVQMVV